MNNSGQFNSAGFNQNMFNSQNPSGSGQDGLYSPRLAGQQNSNVYDYNSNAMKFQKPLEFNLNHTQAVYGSKEYKSQQKSWKQPHFAPNSPVHFQKQVRNSPIPSNYQPQQTKWDQYNTRINSTPRSVSTPIKRDIWPLIKGTIYKNENETKTEEKQNQTEKEKEILFRNVWEMNLEEEMEIISSIIDKFSYISVNTEFPGVVARPPNVLSKSKEKQYHMIKTNVDLMNPLQVSLCLATKDGVFVKYSDITKMLNIQSEIDETKDYIVVWQFHMKYNVQEDVYAKEAIDFLFKSGLKFEEYDKNGIEYKHFGEIMIASGLICNNNITWVSFHGSYDFAYLLKLLTNIPLPKTKNSFIKLLKLFFPQICDVKYVKNYEGGLEIVGKNSDIKRVGPQHNSVSGGLLTLQIFFKTVQEKDKAMFGTLYGLKPVVIQS